MSRFSSNPRSLARESFVRRSRLKMHVAAVGAVLMMMPAARAQNWRLLWSDEFNGAAGSLPSAADWNFVQGWGPKGNHEIQWYCLPKEKDGPCEAGDPNLFEDGDGHLVLKAIHNGQLWSSAR